MSKKTLSHKICLQQFISEEDYKEINQLQEQCRLHDKTNLKLELYIKLNMSRTDELDVKIINEFLYYVGDILVGYLGVGSYGGSNIGEINGMVHPDYRGKGLFRKLFELAMDECQKRNFNKILLLSDGKSSSGTGFIKAVHGEYDFSEYRMKRISKKTLESIHAICLRKAGKQDQKEVARQNAIYFGHSVECESLHVEELGNYTYMIERKGRVVGKIKIEYSNHSAFISGVGILPEFRGKGYGKAALKAALHLISEKNIHETELDVECNNNAALNLYKDCGFEEQSVMDYYAYDIHQ